MVFSLTLLEDLTMPAARVLARISNHHFLKIAFLALVGLLLAGCGWPFGSRKLAFSEVAHLTAIDPDRTYWMKTNVLVHDESDFSWIVSREDKDRILWAYEPRSSDHPTFEEYAANEKHWNTVKSGRIYGALRRGERVKFMYMQANVGSSMGPSMDCVFLVLDGSLAGRSVDLSLVCAESQRGTFPFILPDGKGPFQVSVPTIDSTILSESPIQSDGKRNQAPTATPPSAGL